MNPFERFSFENLDLTSGLPDLTPFGIAAGIVYSVILHEIAHGYVAEKLGDSTARDAGRITLNPFPHIDPYYTVALPVLTGLVSYLSIGTPYFVGAAKGVPVNFNALKYGKWGEALVAVAGPATNIALAIAAGSLLYSELPSEALTPFLGAMVGGNVLLAALNLLPVKYDDFELDGWRIAKAFRSTPESDKQGAATQ